MIYTVTLNPSLDYIVTVDEFIEGSVNRSKDEKIFTGGKGINVSMVLKNLGIESTALGFIGGFTGNEISQTLEDKGISTDFVEAKEGISRINVKLRAKQESEINGQGPKISADELEAFLSKIDCLEDGDTLVLAGSIPKSIPDTIYMDIMKRLSDRDIRIVVDATKDLLLNVLPFHPFMVKPNNHELGEMFGVTLTTNEEIITYAKKLKEMGAVNVLVSMAGDGAILVAEDGTVYQTRAPKGILKNSVGAGDSMVAGFVAGYNNERDYAKAFKTGVCTGSASAFSEELATKEEVLQIMSTHQFDF
ncbi:1-phosphofructokinase [Lachnospiraceae bacterium KM106-2]|nr:1-phosphofructokinase [Lachnospiraceae bacterium KM106-2]